MDRGHDPRGHETRGNGPENTYGTTRRCRHGLRQHVNRHLALYSLQGAIPSEHGKWKFLKTNRRFFGGSGVARPNPPKNGGDRAVVVTALSPASNGVKPSEEPSRSGAYAPQRLGFSPVKRARRDSSSKNRQFSTYRDGLRPAIISRGQKVLYDCRLIRTQTDGLQFGQDRPWPDCYCAI